MFCCNRYLAFFVAISLGFYVVTTSSVGAAEFYAKGIAEVRDDNSFSAFDLGQRRGEGLSTSEFKIEYHFWSLLGDPVFRFRGWYKRPTQARIKVSEKCSQWGSKNISSDDLEFSGGYAMLTEPPLPNRPQTFTVSERTNLFSSTEFLPSTWFALELYSRALNRTVWMETMADTLVRLPAEPGFWTPGAVNWDRLFLTNDPRKTTPEKSFVSAEDAKVFYKSGFIVSRASILKPSVALGRLPITIEELCRQGRLAENSAKKKTKDKGKSKSKSATLNGKSERTKSEKNIEAALKEIDQAFGHSQPTGLKDKNNPKAKVRLSDRSRTEKTPKVDADNKPSNTVKTENCTLKGRVILRHPSWVTNGKKTTVGGAIISIYKDKPGFEWNFFHWYDGKMKFPGPAITRITADGKGRYVIKGLKKGSYTILAETPSGFRAFGRRIRTYQHTSISPEAFDKSTVKPKVITGDWLPFKLFCPTE